MAANRQLTCSKLSKCKALCRILALFIAGLSNNLHLVRFCWLVWSLSLLLMSLSQTVPCHSDIFFPLSLGICQTKTYYVSFTKLGSVINWKITGQVLKAFDVCAQGINIKLFGTPTPGYLYHPFYLTPVYKCSVCSSGRALHSGTGCHTTTSSIRCAFKL